MAKKVTNEKAKAKAVSDLINRAAEIEDFLLQVKPLYRERDDIIAALVEMGVFQAQHNGFLMNIVDNFLEKNTQFRIARFARFEMKIEHRHEPVVEKTKSKTSKTAKKWDFPTKKSRNSR